MELKYARISASGGNLLSSNRTFMELKSVSKSPMMRPTRRSNRTFMELKFYAAFKRIGVDASSNRTFMELKC